MKKCEKCGFMHYRTDPCREPKKSMGALADASSGLIDRVQLPEATVSEIAGAVPAASTTIQKPKRGRPPTGFDKKAYDRAFMVKKRARIKAEKEAGK